MYGASNTGVPPLDAAQQAADRGARVYSIGFGTSDGAEFPNCDQQLMENEPHNDPGGQHDPFGGGGFCRGKDEETRKKIAEMAGGTYYSAENAGELQNVFQMLPT